MNKERLERVCVVLESVPKKLFDLNAWASCSTVYCAIGWAAQDPVLNKEGLHLTCNLVGGSPVFEYHLGWDAVEQFFGLIDTEAYDLFSVGGYSMTSKPSPEEVIAKIRAFINEYEKEGLNNV